jgi:hypothetical protein
MTNLMSIEEIKRNAVAIADELRTAKSSVPPDLRQRFIDLRAALFQRGIFDPVLARFDSATVSHASTQEIAEELTQIAASLV